MTLFSWFDGKNTVNQLPNDISEKSTRTHYFNNYSMWPTAKVKPNIDLSPYQFQQKVINKKLPPHVSVAKIVLNSKKA